MFDMSDRMNPIVVEIYIVALVNEQPLFYNIMRQNGKSTYTIKTKRRSATYKNTVGTFIVDGFSAVTIHSMCREVEERC